PMKSVCDHLKEDLALSEGHSARLLRSLRKVIHCGSAKVSMSLCPLRQGSDSAMLARADAPVLRTQPNRQSFDCLLAFSQEIWLPTLDTLRNFFLMPTTEIVLARLENLC